MKKLQFVSDIHLEHYKKTYPVIEPIDNDGECYLALLGDIGYPHQPLYRKFLEYHAGRFKQILLITGNHEYYSSKNKQHTYEQIEAKIVEVISDLPNVVFLQNSSIQIGKTLFIGTTLWTEIKNCGQAESVMNDYQNIYMDNASIRDYHVYKVNVCDFGGQVKRKRIKKKRRPLSAVDVIEMHMKAKEYIQSKIDDNPEDLSIVVLSHHCPSFSLLKKVDEYSDCYASHLEEYMLNYNLDHWLFGHLHHNVKKSIGFTDCASNCMGYITDKCEDFSVNKHIEFE